MQKLLFTLLAGMSLESTYLAAQTETGRISGHVINETQAAVAAVSITADNPVTHSCDSTVSNTDGTYPFPTLAPGTYRLTTRMNGLAQSVTKPIQVSARQTTSADITLPGLRNVAPGGFWKRFNKAYLDDWRGGPTNGAAPAFRGNPAPVAQPPFPFGVWPYGGSPVIGQPDTNLPPMMQALYDGPNGWAWERSRIKIYGWVNAGFNVSTSNRGTFANAPASYYQISNSIQLDQATLYIERVPDTVQTDHFDWGFRVTNLYGLDYRFTTAKGVLSSQLLADNNKYG